MKRLIIILKAVLLAALFLPAPGHISASDKYQELVNCDLHTQACTRPLAAGVAVTLEVTPKPVKAMQDLSFKVTLSGRQSTAPNDLYIDLGMPGMKMGPNRVRLNAAGNNTYTGQGVIVRCPSGRRIWQATVIVPEVGHTDFIFDVIY